LVVDANAVLPLAIALKRFELIAWRHSETCQFGGCMQLQQLAPRYTLDVAKAGNRPALKQGLGVSAIEAVDHVR
jgi:hypothetical protein